MGNHYSGIIIPVVAAAIVVVTVSARIVVVMPVLVANAMHSLVRIIAFANEKYCYFSCLVQKIPYPISSLYFSFLTYDSMVKLRPARRL